MGEALRSDGQPIVSWSGTAARPRRARRRRVFIEDLRANGHYLRATWHPEGRMFVISTWRDEVCTGSVRLPVEASADLAGLLIDGLAETAAHPTRPKTAAERWAAPLRRWVATLRRKLR